MKIFKGISDAIRKSVKDHFGKESSARISSYIVLAFIVLNSLAFMVIEIVNASIMWRQNQTYTIPTEHIWIFGLILSHHLGLLFYKSREYTGSNEFVAKSNLDKVKSGIGSSDTVEKTMSDEPPMDDYSEEYGADNGEEEG